LCSGVFVAGRDAERVYQQDVVPTHPLASAVSYDIDRQTQQVSASVYGLFEQTAQYNQGLGCSIYQSEPPKFSISANSSANPADGFNWPEKNQPTTPKLSQALADIFAENQLQPNVDTRAIIVIKGGQIVAEQYAAGFDQDSLFLSWSMAKSIISSLIGIWADENSVDIDKPVDIKHWQQDERKNISLRHLLTMSSGLDFKETYVPGTDSTRMLFMEDDMAEYAASAPALYPAGQHWDYSSGTTNILAGYLQQQLGGRLQDSYRFAFDKLFLPAGMRSAVFEPDASGTFVGSSYLYMTARDWAKFGQLYLQRGTLNGQKIVSEQWVDFVKTPTAAAAQGQYGGQFWLNAGEPNDASDRSFKNCPTDMYMASGHNGQFVAVIPSKDLVIVRLGWSNAKRFNLDQHFSAIINSFE
jgi:CubicO group peptidase (beta-lactamase class C family)